MSYREPFFELLREPPERFAPTAPDFFVEDVRLDAAAARFAEFLDPPDLEAVLAPPRLALREPDLLERELDDDPDERPFDAPRDDEPEDFEDEPFADLLDERAFDLDAPDLDAPDLDPEDFDEEDLDEEDFAAVLRAPALPAEDFAADLAALFVDFAAVLRAPALPADDFAADFAEDLPAVLLADFVDLVADRLADLPADLEAVFVPELFDAPLRFAEVERDEVLADFAADLRAAPPLLRADEDLDALLLPPDELRREPLFLVDLDVGLNASTAPVISWVSGFDLSSVGIAASFKGLRVQPSRLQGNVVIPSGFRLTESVVSRTGTIPVDTFCAMPAQTCAIDLPKRLRADSREGFSYVLQRHDVNLSRRIRLSKFIHEVKGLNV